MKCFGTLYGFELKKIFQRPYVPVLLGLMVVATVFLNVRPLFEYEDVAYVDEQRQLVYETVRRYEAIQLERHFAQEDEGRLLENDLAITMREMNAQYQERYEAYAPGLSCVLLNHYLVFDSLKQLGINPIHEKLEHPADFAYATMAERQEMEYQDQSLTQDEIEHWDEVQNTLQIPFVLAYSKGYAGILSQAYWINLMVLAFVFISLCSSFSDDYAYKTQPLLISAKKGRWTLLLARLAAGQSVALVSVLLLFGITMGIQFSVHGVHGAKTPIQLLEVDGKFRDLVGSSLAMEAGQAVLVVVGMSLLVAVFAAALSMLLSKLFRHAIPALALPLGLLLASLIFEVSFTSSHRVSAQIWSYLPIHRISPILLLDGRLVFLGGVELDCISMSFLLYGGLGVSCLLLSVGLWKRHTVERM